MYKLCKTEQAARRQRLLEKGLLQAMLQTHYENISISELCDRLNVPRKSFYRYFTSKDGALFALVDHTLMEFDSFLCPPDMLPGTALGDLEKYFLFWHAHKDLLEALRRSQLSGILVERSTNLALQEQMMPRHFLDCPPHLQRIAVSFSICGLLAMVLQWHQSNYQIPAKEIAQMATQLLTRPLVNL